MGIFDDAVRFLAKVEDPAKSKMNSRKRLTSRQIESLRRKFPGVPGTYLAYLSEVGWGSFRECQFMIYSRPGTPEGILGKGIFTLADDVEVLCFGDNFSGDLSGFLPKQRWAIVELWHDSGTIYPVKKPFGTYIREQMLMGPRGKDLRNDW